MPFSIDMRSTSHPTGKFIIDRNSFIFLFNNFEDRQVLKNFFIMHSILDGMELAEKSFATTDDPRHDALEHVSQYDRHTIHTHLQLKDDIELATVTLLFKTIAEHYAHDDSLDEVISLKCREEILEVASEYFNELELKEEAQTIEQEYREMKEKELKLAEPAPIFELGIISNDSLPESGNPVREQSVPADASRLLGIILTILANKNNLDIDDDLESDNEEAVTPVFTPAASSIRTKFFQPASANTSSDQSQPVAKEDKRKSCCIIM